MLLPTPFQTCEVILCLVVFIILFCFCCLLFSHVWNKAFIHTQIHSWGYVEDNCLTLHIIYILYYYIIKLYNHIHNGFAKLQQGFSTKAQMRSCKFTLPDASKMQHGWHVAPCCFNRFTYESDIWNTVSDLIVLSCCYLGVQRCHLKPRPPCRNVSQLLSESTWAALHFESGLNSGDRGDDGPIWHDDAIHVHFLGRGEWGA